MIIVIKKAPGQSGKKISVVAYGLELSDLKTNGTCIDAMTSTACARNTNSGALAFLPT